jgi:hypothetical protein
MLDAEKREIVDRLQAGRDALNAALDGVSESLAARKPVPDAWSILECVEHVAVVERLLLSRLISAVPTETSHENRMREAMIAARGADRGRPIAAPEAARPRNRFGSLRDALDAFDSARGETLRFLDGFNGDSRFCVTDHPLIPGPVNCYEILLLISVHPARHAKQIAETRTSLAAADRQD